MTITQTVEVPDDRWLKIKVPPEIPVGKTKIVYFPVREEAEANNTPMPHRSKGEFRLQGDFSQPLKERVLGCLKGQIWMSDDFDEPLEDFKDYM